MTAFVVHNLINWSINQSLLHVFFIFSWIQFQLKIILNAEPDKTKLEPVVVTTRTS